jgi:transposase
MWEARSRIEPPAQDMKVFWFFSSEKNFLPLTFPTTHRCAQPAHRMDVINAGLRLGYTALRGGDLVGSFGFDSAIRHDGQPLRGTAAFSRLQHRAAELAYTREETKFPSASRNCRSG